MSASETEGREPGVGFTVPLFIDGNEYCTDKTFDVVSPATGKVVHQCSSASLADAAAAVDAAAEVFKAWKKSTPSQRRDIFLKAAEIIDSRREELTRYVMEETGAIRSWCEADLYWTVECLKDVAGRISALEGSFPLMMDPDTSGIIMKEPYGVVFAITPWNAPYVLATRSVVFPIAVGNTVVLKATELAPRSVLAVASAFQEAGLPRGVLNVIVHEPAAAASIASAVIGNPHVRKINFTGSTAVGRIIGRLAGENLKPLVLELGGKASAIVWDDADMKLAADQCVLGAFMHSGQICMSTERILVHKSVKQQFIESFKACADQRFPSSGDAPTLISSAAVQKNKNLVADAARKGASLILGSLDTHEMSTTRLRPIVVDGVTEDMDIYKTESFGPTVSLFEIDSEEQAIRMANDTEYGLSAAVFTEDLRRGLRIAREIETGGVHINGMTVHSEWVLPHGGAKASGYGRFNALKGLEEWVWTKSVTFKK